MACWRPEGWCRPRDLTDAMVQRLHKLGDSFDEVGVRVRKVRVVRVSVVEASAASGGGAGGVKAKVVERAVENRRVSTRLVDQGGMWLRRDATNNYCKCGGQGQGILRPVFILLLAGLRHLAPPVLVVGSGHFGRRCGIRTDYSSYLL